MQIVNQVNKVYSKSNPSTYLKDFLNKSKINKYINNRKNFYLKLKLTDKSFKNSTVLDLGSGMGQNTIPLSYMGANCTLVEYDKKSFLASKKLFQKFSNGNFKILNKDIFKFKTKEKFDFVISNGVAHHTQNALKILNRACSFVKKEGFIIIGIANQAGMFQRNLMRYILFAISSNEKEIEKNAKILFKESLIRSKKYSGRSFNEIISDTFINPKFAAITTYEIFEMFKKHKIASYSNYPEIKSLRNLIQTNETQFKLISKNKQFYNPIDFKKDFFIQDLQSMSLNNNANSVKINQQFFKIENLKKKVATMVNDKNSKKYKIDLKKYLNLIKQYNKELKKINKLKIIDISHEDIFYNEVTKIIEILKSTKDKNILFKKLKICIHNSKKIFKGFNGVGMNYYVGFKN